jgi:hypothetical protein
LANSSVTVNGTAISLGASGTVTAAAGTLTGTTLNSTVVTASLVTDNVALNTAAVFNITDGTTVYLSVDSRNTISGMNSVTIAGSPPTIASATTVTYAQLYVKNQTITLTGSTATTLEGASVYVDVPTVTDASAVTLTSLSTMYVSAPVVSGSATSVQLYAMNINGRVRMNGGINWLAGAVTCNIAQGNVSSWIMASAVNRIVINSAGTASGAGGTTFTGENMTIASATSALQAFSVATANKTVTYAQHRCRYCHGYFDMYAGGNFGCSY